MRTYPCRGCGRPIIWIKTPGGKSIPCDPREVAYWQCRGGRHRIVTRNGEVVSAELEGMPGTMTGIGYISHFATCPQATNFRKRGER